MHEEATAMNGVDRADVADSARLTEALQRLLPSVDRFTKGQDAAQFPA